MTDTFTCRTPEGVEYVLKLPDVEVKTKVENKFICRHEVMIDGQPMEIVLAVRYLFADRERILTELADMREWRTQQERTTLPQKDNSGTDAEPESS